MNNSDLANSVFRQPRSKAESKADITDRTAREITKAETENRDAKTAKLREARLERERNQPETAEAAKPARRKRVKK
ncbi:MAG: hypothetical protein KDJ63_01335 [Nitratireductor sp.]|nr:hypothetical protein [Nitratireductor sp.]